ncbi:MAG: Ig-like domain-containing protein [candidate division WOR-3 bacterium]
MKKSSLGNRYSRLIGLLGSSFLVMFTAGCKLANPLTGDTNQPEGTGADNPARVAAIIPGPAGFLADDNPDQAGIQATVSIIFADYMDPSSVSAANVTVLNTTTGTEVTGLGLTYNADARRLLIRCEDWPQSSEFLLTLKTGGFVNRFGAPLDGNGNGRKDATPYDDFLTTFYVSGGNPANCVPTVPPVITAAQPDTARITDPKPRIAITFSAAMDSTTLKTGTSPKNIKLAPEGGNEMPLDLLSMTPTQLVVVPRDSLIYGRRYVVTLASSQVKADYPTRTPEYLKTLDAGADGAQPTEPDFTWYFSVDTLAPPLVSQVQRLPRGAGVFVEFSALMDTSSLGLGRVRIFDNSGYVPGTVQYFRTPGNATRIEYYFSRACGPSLRVFVSHLVRNTNNTLLDSDGNGIGGELTDDYNRWL